MHRSLSHLATAAFLATVVGLPIAVAQQPAQSPQRAAAKAPAKPTSAVVHKLAIQVNENQPAVMNLALNNAKNVLDHYKAKGEKAEIEIVAYGPGLHMLRDDTSPVKVRIAEMALAESSLKFIACANTQANQSKAEQKPIALISEAHVMPSGVVRLMELQRQGYAYVRP
jgi:hypothetical protein